LTPRDEQPATLGELLHTLAGRLRKVDLRLIDEVRALWPSVVDSTISQHFRPEFVKNGVLLVSVPSGAYAQRVMSDGQFILEGFSSLGSRAPTSIRTVLAPPENR
jgi:predicted nucleic acid-binding Zn ribbon protein